MCCKSLVCIWLIHTLIHVQYDTKFSNWQRESLDEQNFDKMDRSVLHS